MKQTTKQQQSYAAIRRQLLRDNIRAAFLMAKCRAITERIEAIEKARVAA